MDDVATISTFTHITLDGVVQGPGHPDEDRRGGFELGGWEPPYADDVLGRFAAAGMAREGALLFGRHTYEHFATVWPNAPQPNPFTDVLNRTRKFVASRTLREPLPWENSTLLAGEATETVAELKASFDGDVTILGSGQLVRSLLGAGLIDELVLLIHPLVLGDGHRLFDDAGHLLRFTLADEIVTTTGVIIATYRPAS
jgi:dihydrofolate reductase